MGSGLYFDPKDGGPAMIITAGLRIPSFCMEVSTQFDVNQYSVTNYYPGSQIVVMPKDTVYMVYRGTNLIPTIGMLDSVTISGSTITFNTWWSDNWGRARTFNSNIFQIYPASTGSGLLISDSTNMLTITDGTLSGYCVWRGVISFTGSWTTPTTNIDRSRYIVFASWSAAGVTIEFDGNAITAYADRAGDDVPATVTMTVAIFASGVAPTPGPGLNFFNAQGGCTFSLSARPFIYLNTGITLSWSAQDIGNRMIMLGRFGYNSGTNGGWDYLKWAGLIRNGNSVQAGRGRTVAEWTDQYSVVGQRLTSITIPCIESMY